jgi:SAM-dependent methyltransferase
VSRALLDEHRRIWEAKPVLGSIYGRWFDLLLEEAPNEGRALEIGAGPGFLGAHTRRMRPDLRLVQSDILAAPWQDLVADCLQLPLRRRSMDAVLGIDVIHHLARPAAFFSEAARVLGAGGRLAVVEPWVTPLSFPIYRWLHQEGCRPGLDPWDPFELGTATHKEAFQGDGAVMWKLARATPASRWHDLGFGAPRLTLLNGFAYLLSLGFKRGSLLPQKMAGVVLALDDALGGWAPWLGMRVLAVWERRPDPGLPHGS